MSLITKFDCLDNRRELIVLLSALKPIARFRFLGWACSQVSGVRPAASWFRMRDKIVAATRGDEVCDLALTLEIYGDLISLDLEHGLPIGQVAVKLEEFVRHPGAFAVPVVDASRRSFVDARSPDNSGISNLPG
jgi:hypothetical protein